MSSSRLIAAAVLLISSHPSGRPACAQPNIVLIISDDQAWTDYGFMGHPANSTPNLDKLAARGALFQRGYVRPRCAGRRSRPS
jgi:arylsulfatase A-like enzyme